MPILGVIDSAKTGRLSTTAYAAMASTTLGSATSTVTLSSIDQTYQHLVIRCTIYGTGSSESNYYLQFNGDSGANYNYNLSVGDGGSFAALSAFNQTSLGWGYTYGNYGFAGRPPVCAQFIIPMYSDTTQLKSIIEYEGVTGQSVGGAQSLGANWNSTAAINSVTLFSTGNNMAAQTSFALYGIKGS